MTIVEFFDKVSVDNMISCLTVKPEKIIFIGDRKPMTRQCEAYKRLAERKGIDVDFEFVSVIRSNLQNIVEALEKIVQTEAEVAFDLTGGEDLILVAMGMVYERYKSTKNIQMHRFNVGTGVILDCDYDGTTPTTEVPELTVEENIMLYGGAIVPFNGHKGTYDWDLNPDFTSDLEVLWGVCKRNPGLWNAQIHTVYYFLKFGSAEPDSLKITASKTFIEKAMLNEGRKFTWDIDYMKALERYGFINSLSDSEDFVSFCFKNEQIKQCLTKAGTLLELIVYYYSTLAVDKNGRKRFNDSRIGVYIDWDSSIHTADDDEKDTENEIDVILMRGLIPIFISCKNGDVNENELYKLNTVAERFGGPYAKKVLVTSYAGKLTGDSRKYFEQRVKDMKIQLIEGVHELTDSEFEKKIKNIVC